MVIEEEDEDPAAAVTPSPGSPIPWPYGVVVMESSRRGLECWLHH